MVMNDPSDHQQEVTEVTESVALLSRQAAALRAELVRLRQDLTQVEQDFRAMPGAQLREANEQLVLAALRAQVIADTARRNLGEMTGAARAQLPTPSGPAPAEDETRFSDLLEANEKLVLAALSSQELEADAREAHRRQVTFLAMVAHELRNPLMPLKMAADLLDRAASNERLLGKLRVTINGQVAHMSRLIGDLLDGSRINTGKFKLERSIFELSGILELAIETCRSAIEARRQRFRSLVPPGSLRVDGDSVRMVQVFSNLLDNACKFTPQGGEISLAVARLGDTVSISVSDNGIGITAQALPHVFEMFVQDAHATVANRSGLGIGLAVVRDLVDAHGGSVVANSAGKDQGSEFIVTLPLVAASLNGSM